MLNVLETKTHSKRSKLLTSAAVMFLTAAAMLVLSGGTAYAASLGWDPSGMASNIAGTTNMNVTGFTQATIAGWVTSATNWLLGIVLFLIVAKIVLTAVCRVLDDSTTTELLKGLPIIGAYTDGTWLPILKKVAFNIGVALCAWVIVQLLVQIAVWVSTTFIS